MVSPMHKAKHFISEVSCHGLVDVALTSDCSGSSTGSKVRTGSANDTDGMCKAWDAKAAASYRMQTCFNR